MLNIDLIWKRNCGNYEGLHVCAVLRVMDVKGGGTQSHIAHCWYFIFFLHPVPDFVVLKALNFGFILVKLVYADRTDLIPLE